MIVGNWARQRRMFTRPAIALAETTIGLYNPTSATLVSGMKGRGWPSLPTAMQLGR